MSAPPLLDTGALATGALCAGAGLADALDWTGAGADDAVLVGDVLDGDVPAACRGCTVDEPGGIYWRASARVTDRVKKSSIIHVLLLPSRGQQICHHVPSSLRPITSNVCPARTWLTTGYVVSGPLRILTTVPSIVATTGGAAGCVGCGGAELAGALFARAGCVLPCAVGCELIEMDSMPTHVCVCATSALSPFASRTQQIRSQRWSRLDSIICTCVPSVTWATTLLLRLGVSCTLTTAVLTVPKTNVCVLAPVTDEPVVDAPVDDCAGGCVGVA